MNSLQPMLERRSRALGVLFIVLVIAACIPLPTEPRSGQAYSPQNTPNELKTVQGRRSQELRGPLVILSPAANFVPTVDYFGIGWSGSESSGDSRFLKDYHHSRGEGEFLKPPTVVNIGVSVHLSKQSAVDEFNEIESRNENKGKGRPNIGE